MPTKFYKSFVRPNTSVNFPEEDTDFTQKITDLYVSTGKCLDYRKESYSDDNLTKTIVSTWVDETVFLEALSDPIWDENNLKTLLKVIEYDITVFSWIE